MTEAHASNQTAGARVVRWAADNGVTAADDALAVEQPLEIRVRGRAVCVTMRTPGDDAALAAGFLLSEGMVRGDADIERIDPCVRAIDGNVINVFLSASVVVDFDKLTRHVFASSSCGLCGRASLDAVQQCLPPIRSSAKIDARALHRLAGELRRAQPVFDRTGGLHAAGLFGTDGLLRIAAEDVGRHNAVDKVLGRALLDKQLPLRDSVLVVSGRASFEVVQKTLAAGVPIIAAVSAPTSLAVELAQESGQTLVGFVRPGRMNVYSHTHRIAM